MSALNSDTVPAQDAASSLDVQQQQLQQLQQQQQQQQQDILVQPIQGPPSSANESARKRPYPIPISSRSHRALIPTFPAKAPSVRRACVACHSGKTRCSEVLPCQVCRSSTPPPRPQLTPIPIVAELPQARPRAVVRLPRPRCPRAAVSSYAWYAPHCFPA